MEKKTPHYRLPQIKSLVTENRVSTTHSARTGASALGLTLDGMLEIVMALTPADFYKSMTTHQDHKLWQDVYPVHAPRLALSTSN